MYFAKTILSLSTFALLTCLSSALLPSEILTSGDVATNIAAEILTASDSGPESSYSVNPTVVQTGVAIATISNAPGSLDTLTKTTTSIPTNILTAPDSEPTGLGSMSTVIATTAGHQSQEASASTSSGHASPTPTDDAAVATFGSPVLMLGAVLVPLVAPWF